MYLLTIDKIKNDGTLISLSFRFNEYNQAYAIMTAIRMYAESALPCTMFISDVNGDFRAISRLGANVSELFPNDQ